jgi:hypothetical protein
LAMHDRESPLGSHAQFLWTPLPSPTFSLPTGQWLDFHQLADYHASRTWVSLSLYPSYALTLVELEPRQRQCRHDIVLLALDPVQLNMRHTRPSTNTSQGY